MKKESKKKREQNSDTDTTQTKRKVSKTMEAARRLKGSIIVLDPTILYE